MTSTLHDAATLVSILALLAAGACSFDATGLPRGPDPDSAPQDGARPDKKTKKDKKPPPKDTKPPPKDTKPPPKDKKPPPKDTKPPPPPLPSCKKLFGHHRKYHLCAETGTSCRWFHDEGIFGGYYSCDFLCKPGKCLGAADTQSWDRCGQGAPTTCAVKHYSSTCVCSKK